MTKYLYIGAAVLFLALGGGLWFAVDRWIDAEAEKKVAVDAAKANKKALDDFQHQTSIVSQIAMLAHQKAASDALEITTLRTRLKNVPTCPLQPADRDAIFNGLR